MKNNKRHQGIETTWNGKTFPSITLAAATANVSISAMREYLRRGYTCDDDVPPSQRVVPVTIDGIHYPNQKAAAQATGLDDSVVSVISRRQRFPEQYDGKDRRGKPTTWEGVTYPSLVAAAKAAGLKPAHLARLLKRGIHNTQTWAYSNRNAHPIEIHGTRYTSVIAARKVLKITRKAIDKLVASGKARWLEADERG